MNQAFFSLCCPVVHPSTEFLRLDQCSIKTHCHSDSARENFATLRSSDRSPTDNLDDVDVHFYVRSGVDLFGLLLMLTSESQMIGTARM